MDIFSVASKNPMMTGDHIALFLWIQSLGARDFLFEVPTTEGMLILSVSRSKFGRLLSDLHDFGSLKVVKKSKNQYTNNIVLIGDFIDPPTEIHKKIVKRKPAPIKEEVFEVIEAEEVIKEEDIPVKITIQDKKKNITKNNQLSLLPIDDTIQEQKPVVKKSPVSSSLIHRIRLIVEDRSNGNCYWTGTYAKNAKHIVDKIRFRMKSSGSDPTDDAILNAFIWFLDNLPEKYKLSWDITKLNFNFDSIMMYHQNKGKVQNNSNKVKSSFNAIKEAMDKI